MLVLTLGKSMNRLLKIVIVIYFFIVLRYFLPFVDGIGFKYSINRQTVGKDDRAVVIKISSNIQIAWKLQNTQIIADHYYLIFGGFR